tara:strand:- start:183697 stop:184080 length:384 start_codon:yes stop_codon:yes gene_type:complete
MTQVTSRASALLGRTELAERNQDALEAIKNLNKVLGKKDQELWTHMLQNMLEKDGKDLKEALTALQELSGNLVEIVDDLALGLDEAELAGESAIHNLDDINKYAAGAANALTSMDSEITAALQRIKA